MKWAAVEDKPEPIQTDRLLKKMKFMEATLPSKNIDEESGRERTAVYVKLLGEASEEAITYMTNQACARFDWFPTPKQCLELIAEYKRVAPRSEKTIALLDGRYFLEDRMAEFMKTLASRDESAIYAPGIPERWRRIAEERGFLRYSPEGKFVLPKLREPVQSDDVEEAS